MDTSVVKIYKQLGASPNPATDTLLGSDNTFESGAWSVNTSGWSEGRYTIYAVGYDLAGNQSSLSSKGIGVLPNPMKVSGLVDWQIGEMNTTQIGIFSS